jgi:uncharacterized protein YegP (UPF0339 family)
MLSSHTPRSRTSPSPARRHDLRGLAAPRGLFAVYQDRAEKYRFRLKVSNGQVVATGEGYETKSAAKKGSESVQRAADGAPVVVETDG